MTNKCKHNSRTQYANGYYCRDCNRFISSDTDEYKLTEGISDLWMVLHNFACDNPDKETEEIKSMKEKLFLPENPTIELYNEALNLIHSLGLKETDARVTLDEEIENEFENPAIELYNEALDLIRSLLKETDARVTLDEEIENEF